MKYFLFAEVKTHNFIGFQLLAISVKMCVIVAIGQRNSYTIRGLLTIAIRTVLCVTKYNLNINECLPMNKILWQSTQLTTGS